MMMNLPSFGRLARFAAKPWRKKYQSFGFRWIRNVPGIPLPLRLPFGAWWLVENDFIGASLLEGQFERGEQAFVAEFLQPGMTAVDIGANRGLYSLISAFKVGESGRSGRVLAFEPSAREIKKLKQHIRLNRCRNISVFDCALGESEGTADLYVVGGMDTGCNSLRQPDIKSPVRMIRVPVKTLDQVLSEQSISSVDFMKLDIEGGEFAALKGATRLLEGSHPPVILCEVQDQRTAPWGYAARSIIEYLSLRGYLWFEPQENGRLRPLPMATNYDGNYVAWPQVREADGRKPEFRRFLAG
jgi:FkbM family methyltransferase